MTKHFPVPSALTRLAKAAALTCGTLGFLAACSLTPDYVRPDTPVAAGYPATAAQAGDHQTPATTVAETGWEDFFPDQRLQGLIKAALYHNRDLRTAAFRIEEARALYNIQSADQLPNLGGAVTGNRGRTPGSVSPTGTSVVGSNYQVGLNLAAFELDFFGRVRSLSDAALGQYLATEEARRAAHISVVAEVAKAYLAERAFTEQLELVQNSFNARQRSFELAKQRFDVGASSALDLRQNEVLVETARLVLLGLTRQRAQAENALTLLVGTPLNQLDLPPVTTLSKQTMVTELPAGLPSDLLIQRPDIRAAEYRLKSSNANIGAARAAFFPRISLTAGIGSASSSLSDLFESGSRTWSFMPQLVLPIFDAGRNRSNLSLAQARNHIAVADYEKTIQDAFREVADALAARATLDDEVRAQQAVATAQSQRLELADLRYKNGISSSLELLDAQRDLFAAQQNLVQTRLLRLTNGIDLYRSLGGGLYPQTIAGQADAASGDQGQAVNPTAPANPRSPTSSNSADEAPAS